jgi:hypothetical protein
MPRVEKKADWFGIGTSPLAFNVMRKGKCAKDRQLPTLTGILSVPRKFLSLRLWCYSIRPIFISKKSMAQ